MITQGEKQQIRQLLQQPQWQIAERVANELCDKIAYDAKQKETQWQLIKSAMSILHGIQTAQPIFFQAHLFRLT